MSNSWKRARLGDLVTHQKGFAFKSSTYTTSGRPIVRVSDFTKDSIDLSSCAHVADDLAVEFDSYRLQHFDVLIATVGSWPTNPESVVGKTVGVPANATGALLNQNAVRLRSRSNLNQRFLYYLLKDASFGAYIVNTAQGSANQASITLKDVFGFEFALPPREEQDAIVAVLGALDDKIAQNHRTGRKLEALARATFKAWFVDFEPVKAKAAGATAFPGMPPETFAALPTRFEDSELGPVPQEWDVRTMDNIGTQRREQIAPEDTDGETPYIGLEHMPRRDIALSDWGTAASVTSSKFRFRRGDILFGKLRPYFHKVGRAAIDGMCSTDIVVLHPKKPESAAWLLMLVSSDEFVAHTDRSSAGTKMPRTNWKDMAAFKTTLPPSQVVLAFQEQVGSMLDLITASIHESRRLATLRDYLLPRLLSGRVRVTGVDDRLPAAETAS